MTTDGWRLIVVGFALALMVSTTTYFVTMWFAAPSLVRRYAPWTDDRPKVTRSFRKVYGVLARYEANLRELDAKLLLITTQMHPIEGWRADMAARLTRLEERCEIRPREG